MKLKKQCAILSHFYACPPTPGYVCRVYAESCNAAIAVEENTSNFESTKLLNFY